VRDSSDKIARRRLSKSPMSRKSTTYKKGLPAKIPRGKNVPARGREKGEGGSMREPKKLPNLRRNLHPSGENGRQKGSTDDPRRTPYVKSGCTVYNFHYSHDMDFRTGNVSRDAETPNSGEPSSKISKTGGRGWGKITRRAGNARWRGRRISECSETSWNGSRRWKENGLQEKKSPRNERAGKRRVTRPHMQEWRIEYGNSRRASICEVATISRWGS